MDKPKKDQQYIKVCIYLVDEDSVQTDPVVVLVNDQQPLGRYLEAIVDAVGKSFQSLREKQRSQLKEKRRSKRK